MSRILHVSLGVFAHNEEKNINSVLKSIATQELNDVVVDEVIVVSSGSFDTTNQIVRDWEKKDSRYKLIVEPLRRGKSAAINLFISQARADILLTISADLKLHRHAVKEICQPFFHSDVGMVGAHPVPLNQQQSSVSEAARLMWELHHRISLIKPKCGEMVAFRNIIRELPTQSAVDEATIEVLLQLLGYTVVYAPRAIVYNRVPENAKAYMTQRRRVYAGHQWVAHKYKYSVVTMHHSLVFKILAEYLLQHPTKLIVALRLVIMELVARILGYVDYHVFNKNPYVWDMISR